MYVLDTNICSYLMKRSHPALIERVKEFAPRELKISRPPDIVPASY
jgi:predicted nucleic acid-binding protein